MATTPTSERNADGTQSFDFFSSANPNDPQPIPPGEAGGVPSQGTGAEGSASPDGATGSTQDGTVSEPKHDPTRYEFWQREANLLRDELSKVKDYLPIARYVQENPHLLQAVEADLKQKKAGPSGPPELPQAPAQPSDYDEGAAYTDPASTSFKYRVALDRYNSSKLDYLIQRQEYDKRQQDAAWQEQQRREKETQQLVQFRDAVMQQYNLPEQDANAFVQWYMNPQFSVDQGLQLFRMNRSMAPAQARPQQREGGPAPVGVSPAFNTLPPVSANRTEEDEGKDFTSSLMDTYYKRRGVKPPNR